MSTLPESPVEKFPEDSLETQVYSIVENYSEFMPVHNDRNRLAYALLKFVSGEGDEPLITVKTNKLHLDGITETELAAKLTTDLDKLKK